MASEMGSGSDLGPTKGDTEGDGLMAGPMAPGNRNGPGPASSELHVSSTVVQPVGHRPLAIGHRSSVPSPSPSPSCGPTPWFMGNRPTEPARVLVANWWLVEQHCTE
jgi:hypothetical protein